MMFFIGLAYIGGYFCYDFPASYENYLKDLFKINNSEYNLLYTSYTLPNFFLPCVGGVLVDKFGVRKSLFFFSVLLFIGQGICALAAYIEHF
jgi:MFS family permease